MAVVALFGVVVLNGAQVGAQGAQDGRLIVTVVDATGAVVPGVTVTVSALDDGARAAVLAPISSGPEGVAIMERLLPGRYRVQAEFPGFDTGILPEVRVRRGDNRHVLVLRLKNLEDSITVAQNAQAAASDPRGNAFKTVLTPQEIANLSDDPLEMAQQLQDLAGGNATIRVDSFAGAPLPPKALIKSIHIVRDAFAAENHSAESEEVDIITQPGQGALSGGFQSRVRDGALAARSPFVADKGAERQESFEGNLRGTLLKGKSSFALSIEGRHAFDTPIVFVALPSGGRRSELLDLRRPSRNLTVYGLVDYALTRDQTLRLSYDQSDNRQRNLGIGGSDLIERAYSNNSQDHEFRAQVVGPFGRRTFANSRLQMQWQDSDAVSVTDARTVVVNGAFTSGGAQVAGGRHPRTVELASDVDYVRGTSTFRSGFLVVAGDYRSDNSTNSLGTYTFPSLEAFNAGAPSTYTQRIGSPVVDYSNAQTALYVQDDIRVRKNLTFSPGLRYEIQTHLDDRWNLGPRMGMTWAPFKSGHTTLRASYGIFYNWLNANTYEQTLRVDGFRQQDIFIVNPSYPDPGAAGTVTTTNKYLLGPEVQMGQTRRASAGLDQTLSPKVRLNASFQRVRAADQLRGQNLNAPVVGVRPDPAFANIIQTVSDGRAHSDQLSATLNVNFAGGVRNVAARRWDARRTTVRVAYWIAHADNNFDGAFVVPPSGHLDPEWAPSAGDRRHRYQVALNSQALRNLNASVTLGGNTGTPYTITTGFDDNSDSLFNDRPLGIGRNSVRTSSQATITGNLSYAMALGTAAGSRAIQERDRGGDRPAGQATGKYRLVFTLSVNNLANRSNFTGFSGVQTSPFFLTPTAVQNPRRFDIGVGLRF
ncbi:MAG: TonB-dependent receptor [Vicinamibacterales bacterium]